MRERKGREKEEKRARMEDGRGSEDRGQSSAVAAVAVRGGRKADRD